MDQNQPIPQRNILNNSISWGVYVIWGIITIILLALAIIFTKGSQDWGFEVIGGVIAVVFWIPLSFIIFLIAKKKIAAWIFGILLGISILYIIINLLS